MIRINLLPVKKDRRREAARNQLLIGVLILLLEVVGFVMWNMSVSAEVEEQRNENRTQSAAVEQLKKQVMDHDKILSDIKEYEERSEAIESLQSARSGPVFVMLELSRILSEGGRPHIDMEKYKEMVRLDPAVGYDESWDARRVWLKNFIEDNREVKIEGVGLSHEDVAEFLRRIHLSEFFTEPRLVATDLAKPSVKMEGLSLGDADPVVHFKLEGRVRYR